MKAYITYDMWHGIDKIFIDEQKAKLYFLNKCKKDLKDDCNEFIQDYPNNWEELIYANPNILDGYDFYLSFLVYDIEE